MKNSKKEVQTVKNNEKQVDASLGKTNKELKEYLETLQLQFQQSQTHTIKLQGAIEVISQMLNGEES